MKQKCIQAVAQALGRTLNATELKGIEQRMVKAMRTIARQDPMAWQAKSMSDRLNEAAQLAGKDLVQEHHLDQVRTALTILAHDRIDAHIQQQAQKGMTGLDALDRTLAFHADGKSNFLSIETQARAVGNDALRQMIGTLEASNSKWFGLFENHEGVRSIVKEIFGESTGVKEAADGAKLWKDVTTALRQRFNRAGGDIGELDDWGLPHHHSQTLVAKAGRDKWVQDTLPKLNRAKYVNEDGTMMTDQQVSEFLGHAWESIATGGANKVTPGQFAGNGARANRGSASRQVHFKDADSYLSYWQQYGERGLYEVLVSHVQGVAKDIAMVETYGPNSDHAFRYFRDKLVMEAKLADPTKLGDIEKHAINTENLYNEVSGKTLPVASRALANGFDTLRNWLVASRLGSAIVSSFSDEGTLYLTAKVNRLPQMQVLANELSAMNIANRTELRMARGAGLALNSLIASLNRFGQNGLGAAFSKKLANTVLRASGLNAITEARKRAFGVTMMGALGSITKSHASLKGLDPHDNRILLSKGITDEDFAVWKAAQPEDWGGGNNTMLTPDAIYRVPDSAIASLGDPRKLREQAATKLLGVVLEETDMAVIEPGAKERTITGAQLQRGTWKGELTRSFFLFKSFPLAMLMRHWNRGMSMPNMGGKAAYISTLLATTTVAGVMSLQVSELLSGRDPRNLNPAEKGGVRNWIQAMLKGGSLGIYGDFLFSDASQHGSTPLATVTGPVLGLGEDMFNLTQGNIVQALQGKKTNAGAESVKFVRSNLPGASLWYSKATLDHLIFHQLQEYFSPGYLATMRNRAEREFGQKYYWEPGQPVPDRAPDMGAIVGE
jgi:hypothetical protein